MRREQGLSGGVDLLDPFSRVPVDIDFVSFDLFETLFVSPLPEPARVWDMVGNSIGMPDFARQRAAAEVEARRRAEGGGAAPLSHDAIYDCLDLPPAPREFAKRTELLYESALWQPHPHLRALYVRSAEAGQAVIVADTPLSSAFVAGLLARHGLPEAPLFLSCELGTTSSDGRLFVQAAERLAVSPDRILHLSGRAEDLALAASAGFKTQHVEVPAPVSHDGSGAAALSYGLRRLAPDAQQAPLAWVGFSLLGPLYCGFLRWMEWQARINSIDLLLFLPGIGHGLERVARHTGALSSLRYAYLKTSPLALMLAGITDRTFDEKVGFLIRLVDLAGAYAALGRLGIPVPAEPVLEGLGLGDDLVITAEHHPLVRRFFSAFRWQVLGVAHRNRRALFRTLLELGVTPGARVALVAADWDGSLQETFEHAVAGVVEVEVYGYSLCLLDLPEVRRRQAWTHLKAMLGRESVSGAVLDLLARRREDAEALFVPPHGAVIGYAESSRGVRAQEAATAAERKRQSAVAEGLAEGAEAFARLFGSFVAATGYEPEPLDIAAPFLDGLADVQTAADLVQAQLGSPAVRSQD